MAFVVKTALRSCAVCYPVGNCVANTVREEGISQSQYYSWSKEFMEAGKKRLAGDTMREANTGEVKELRREARDLKEVVAEQALELRLLKKSMTGPYGDARITYR